MERSFDGVDHWIQISTTFCITSNGTCPPTVINWSLTLIVISLIVSIAVYKMFKIWIDRPRFVEYDSEYDNE